MNCPQARQLISPYLDHQLTGREMLALQAHFGSCPSCEREMHSIRQVKALLRGLHKPRLPHDFPGAIAVRLQQTEAGPQGWRVLCLPVPLTLPRPQRGRRLATALALSCLTIVSLVAPFAPEARETTRTSSLLGSDLGSGGPAFAVTPSSETDFPSRVPARITWITVNDLTRLPAADSAAMPRSDALLLTGLSTPPMQSAVDQSSLEMMGRSPDTPFANAQFTVFRPR